MYYHYLTFVTCNTIIQNFALISIFILQWISHTKHIKRTQSTSKLWDLQDEWNWKVTEWRSYAIQSPVKTFKLTEINGKDSSCDFFPFHIRRVSLTSQLFPEFLQLMHNPTSKCRIFNATGFLTANFEREKTFFFTQVWFVTNKSF